MIYDRQVERLIAKNDKPLSTKDAAKERRTHPEDHGSASP